MWYHYKYCKSRIRSSIRIQDSLSFKQEWRWSHILGQWRCLILNCLKVIKRFKILYGLFGHSHNYSFVRKRSKRVIIGRWNRQIGSLDVNRDRTTLSPDTNKTWPCSRLVERIKLSCFNWWNYFYVQYLLYWKRWMH